MAGILISLGVATSAITDTRLITVRITVNNRKTYDYVHASIIYQGLMISRCHFHFSTLILPLHHYLNNYRIAQHF